MFVVPMLSFHINVLVAHKHIVAGPVNCHLRVFFQRETVDAARRVVVANCLTLDLRGTNRVIRRSLIHAATVEVEIRSLFPPGVRFELVQQHIVTIVLP